MALRVDLEIELADSKSCVSDQLGDTIDYGAVIDAIRQRIAITQCRLLEHLAEIVAALVLEEFGARRVSVAIAKPALFTEVEFVGVRVERLRKASLASTST
jgi:dihydroneopterin aldolase